MATPSRNDVFKSISDNVGQGSDDNSGAAFLWILAGIGVIILIAWLGRRQTLAAAPKILNSPSRLLREIMKTLPLKPRDIKQVKTVADEMVLPEGKAICSPLVLLLCPSVLAKVGDEVATRADRATIKAVVRKLGYVPPKKGKAAAVKQ